MGHGSRNRLSSSFRRVTGFVRKETLQMLRDKSTLTLGIILPVTLLLLFGFGLSLDVDHTAVTVVRDDSSPVTRDLFTSLEISPYFSPCMANSMQEAEHAMLNGDTDAIVRREMGDHADGVENIQIIVNGRDANKARIMQRYLEGAITQWYQKYYGGTSVRGRAIAESRVWYNHAMESRYFLVPGVIVLVMTLIGALLTALVIAREWERGTFEAIIATSMRKHEFLLGKIIPYFLLGVTGLGLCLFASYWVFDVPMRGSLTLVIAGSCLYLLVSLGIGLFVSAAVKNQFLASQLVVITCFLPTLMLSGFVFDLNSAPRFVYYFAHIFPATWFVEMLQTLLLVGDIGAVLWRDFSVLLLFAFMMLGLAGLKTRKSLE